MMRRTFTMFLIGFLASPVARAGDAITAEALFREGRSLMDSGNYAAACPKLAESDAQDPATGTLLALAICQERAGQTASSWATYAEVVSRAKRDGRADREQAARDGMAALEPKLSRLTIVVDAALTTEAGLVVKRDGNVVGSGVWGMSVPVDPGEHVVEASAPGRRSFHGTVQVGAENDAQTVRIPPLDDDPVARSGGPLPAAPTAGSVAPTRPRQRPVADARPHGIPLRTVGLIVGGVGVVGLGVSGYLGLHARGLNADSKEGGHCNARNECDVAGGAKRDDAKAAANGATIALVAGGLLTATGVTLFLVGGRKAATHVEATSVVGWNEAAVIVRGGF